MSCPAAGIILFLFIRSGVNTSPLQGGLDNTFLYFTAILP
jgi:hypothetical protein